MDGAETSAWGGGGATPICVNHSTGRLAFYYYQKQLTFEESVSLTRRQKSILEMFNKS